MHSAITERDEAIRKLKESSKDGASIEHLENLVSLRDSQILDLQSSLEASTASSASVHKKLKDQLVESRTEAFDLRNTLSDALEKAARVPVLEEKLKNLEMANANETLVITKLKDDLKTLKTDVKNKSAQISRSETTLLMRTEEMETLEQEYRKTASALAVAKEENCKLISELDKLQVEKDQASKRSIVELDLEASQLKDQIRELQEKTQSEVHSVNTKLENEKAKNAEMLENVDVLNSRLELQERKYTSDLEASKKSLEELAGKFSLMSKEREESCAQYEQRLCEIAQQRDELSVKVLDGASEFERRLSQTKGEAEERLARLENEKLALNGHLESLTKELAESKSRISLLELENVEYREKSSKLDELESSILTLTVERGKLLDEKQKNDAIISQVEELETELGELIQDKDCLETKIYVLQSSIETKDSEIRDLMNARTCHESKISDLQSSIESKDQKMRKLETEMETIEKANSSKDLIIGELELARNQISELLSARDSALSDLKAEIASKEIEMENIQGKLLDASSRVEQLQQKLDLTIEVGVSHALVQREQKERIEKLESDLIYQRSKAEKTEFEAKAVAEVDILKESLRSLQEENTHLETQLETFKLERKELVGVKESLEKLADEKLILAARIDGLEIHNTGLSRQLESHVKELKDLAVSSAEAKAETEIIREKLERACLEVFSLF